MKRKNVKSLAGLRVSVIGLGRFGGGVGVTQWLCGQGAKVTVSDAASPESLAESIAALDRFDVELHIGGHREDDFTKADLLIVNPAVPKESPLLKLAEKADVPRTSEINLFLERCPAKVVGITGSVGKSTTTAMTGKILATKYRTFVGGNIGKSLLNELDDMNGKDIVVLELSSFQLEDLPIVGVSPCVALVTNLAANHLDRHGTMLAYGQAKKNIFRFQHDGDVAIFNSLDREVAAWADEAPANADFFPIKGADFSLTVPGGHNQLNAQAAWAIAKQFGITKKLAAAALKDFKGLPHRLAFVCEKRGIRYFNDSKSTTPAGACVALNSFDKGRVVILLGGYDKGADFTDMARLTAARAKAAVTFGKTGSAIYAAINGCLNHCESVNCDNLMQAVEHARKFARKGDVILLSPACASYDQFDNYERRGELFVKLAQQD